VLLTFAGEQNPERINSDNRSNRKMKEQEYRHDDGQNASPASILKQPDARGRDAGSESHRAESNHGSNPADKMRNSERHIRRQRNRQMAKNLAGKQDDQSKH